MHIGEYFQYAGVGVAAIGGGFGISEAGTDLVVITTSLTAPALAGLVLWGIGALINKLAPLLGHNHETHA